MGTSGEQSVNRPCPQTFRRNATFSPTARRFGGGAARAVRCKDVLRRKNCGHAENFKIDAWRAQQPGGRVVSVMQTQKKEVIMTHHKPQPGDRPESVSAMVDNVGGWAAKLLSSVSTSKESFAEIAGMADIYEIKASKMALQRAHRSDVKLFAQQMIKDHARTNDDLKSMLGSLNEPIQPPAKLNTLFQILIDDLSGAPDDDFDKRYLAQQESVHSAAVTLTRTYRDRGDNSALRELAKLAVPFYEGHLKMVQQLRHAA
jgi:putative membrane protein